MACCWRGGGSPAVPGRRRRGTDGGRGGAAEPRGSAPPPRLRRVPQRCPLRRRLPCRRRLHAPPYPRLALLPLLTLPTSSGGADGARRHGVVDGARIHGGEGAKTWIPLCVDMRYAAAPLLPPVSLSFFSHLTVLPSLFPDPVKEPPRVRFEKLD